LDHIPQRYFHSLLVFDQIYLAKAFYFSSI